MQVLVYFLLLSFAHAASLEETLKATLESDLACPPQAPTYCEDFHAAGCTQNDFQPDGTGEVRTMKAFEVRVGAATKKLYSELVPGLLAKYKKLNQAQWKNLVLQSSGLKSCTKFPATAVCLKSVAQSHVKGLVVNLRRPAQNIQFGSFVDDGIRGDPYNILAQESVNAFAEKLTEEVRYKDDEKKMLDMVDGIKRLLQARIQNSAASLEAKAQMLAKLEGTIFAGFKCDKNSLLQSYELNGAFNTRVSEGKHEISYCAGNFRTNSSSFNLAYLLAHEFAHSIDPCNMKPADISKNERNFLERQHPFANVVGCLRSPDSLGAEWSPDFYKENLPNLSLCIGDQIGESFSDWMASEVVPQYIESAHPGLSTEQWKQGFLNVSRTLSCEARRADPMNQGGVDSHPRPRLRINKIMLANPQIKSLVGCQEGEKVAVHCEESTNVAELTPPRDPSTRISLDHLGTHFKPSLEAFQNPKHNEEACFIRH